jgi:hypothetical protein
MSFDLAAVPGVPETHLSPSVLATLPVNLAPAPWTVRADAVVWWGRPSAAAQRALPDGLARTSRAVMVVGGLVRYRESPVGRYDEVFGVIGCRRGRRFFSTVAFMAVDSTSSLVGGRTNWSMPKTLARFSGSPSSAMSAQGSGGEDWAVTSRARIIGPALPARGGGRVEQVFPDGLVRGCRMSSRGRARTALVSVGVSSTGTLAEWLRPGRHLGAVLEDMEMSFTPAHLDVIS